MPQKLLSVHLPLYRVNALDFPFREVVQSALPIADELLLACPPTDDDGTREAAEALRAEHPDLIRLLLLDWWKPEARAAVSLADVTNFLIDSCAGAWHLALQADEVVHEDQAQTIRELAAANTHPWVELERFNFFGTFDAYNGNRGRWPCSVVRLARRDWFPHICSYGDATHLGIPHGFHPARDARLDARDQVQLWHYSYVRWPRAYVERQAGMAALFGMHEDPRITAWRERGRIDWWEMAPREELVPIPGPHPAVMTEWIAARRDAVASGVLA